MVNFLSHLSQKTGQKPRFISLHWRHIELIALIAQEKL